LLWKKIIKLKKEKEYEQLNHNVKTVIIAIKKENIHTKLGNKKGADSQLPKIEGLVVLNIQCKSKDSRTLRAWFWRNVSLCSGFSVESN